MAATKVSLLSQKRSRLAAMAARPRPAAKPALPIRDIRAHVIREPAGRNTYLVVRIDTDGGPTGYGETTARPDPAAALRTVLACRELLRGRDALAAEAAHQALLRESGRPAAQTAGVRAAVNMALLDILGKVSKVPTREALSGNTRNKARAFASLSGNSPEALEASLQRAQAAGFRAFQVPLAVPAGPTRGRAFYRKTYALLDRLRKTGGEQADFILDCGGNISPAEAAGLAAEFETFHLLWLEQPVASVNLQVLARLSGETVTPLGLGRDIVENSGFQDLLRLDAIDVLRPDIARAGITPIRRAAALAEAYYVAVAPFHRGGPVATAAALQLAASIPNFFIQEIPYPADGRDLQMRRELAGAGLEKAVDGFLALPGGPGLGLEINEDALRRYEAAIG